MNIWVIQGTVAVLLLAMMFGTLRKREKMKPKSFNRLLINFAATIAMFILLLSNGIENPAGWIFLSFLTAILIGKTILYYRGAKTESLENPEVA